MGLLDALFGNPKAEKPSFCLTSAYDLTDGETIKPVRYHPEACAPQMRPLAGGLAARGWKVANAFLQSHGSGHPEVSVACAYDDETLFRLVEDVRDLEVAVPGVIGKYLRNPTVVVDLSYNDRHNGVVRGTQWVKIRLNVVGVEDAIKKYGSYEVLK